MAHSFLVEEGINGWAEGFKMLLTHNNMKGFEFFLNLSSLISFFIILFDLNTL